MSLAAVLPFAAVTFERGFGFHPLSGFVDHEPDGTSELLAVLLRPGNATDKSPPQPGADAAARPALRVPAPQGGLNRLTVPWPAGDDPRTGVGPGPRGGRRDP